MAKASSRTLGPGVPPSYLAKLVGTKWQDTYLIVPIDTDLEIGGGPIIPPEVPPGGGGGGGGLPGTSALIGPVPAGSTPPATAPADAAVMVMKVEGEDGLSYIWVGPHLQHN